ncbi:MAG: hypothetical protein Q8L34_04150, partial [Candidatus Woesearchaeota archaeon]|nr:hypothetical protein [Candidatus Woesearchaeota archaeon]
MVVEYAETQQRLRDGLYMRQIAERNPDLIDASKVNLYVNGLETRLETLENHPDRIAQHDWEQKDIALRNRCITYSMLGMGLLFGSTMLGFVGWWMMLERKDKLVQALQKKV